MLEALRSTLHKAITSPVLDGVPVVRFPKDLARRLNATLGRPLAPHDELVKRRAARERLATLRAQGGSTATTREPSPVMVYFEGDRNVRELERTKELLESRGISFRLLDVTGDDAAKSFVTREAKCELDELPVTFVGGDAVGNYPALVAFDVRGDLRRAVFGDERPS